MKNAWANKSAVIIGGSSGLGRHLAERLIAQRVGRLLVVARDSERLSKAVEELKSAHAGTTTAIEALPADLATSDGAEALTQFLKRSNWSVDLLINAVGLSDRGRLSELATERLQQLVAANIQAPLLAVQSCVGSMPTGSVIVNIGSLSSYFAPRFLGGYSIVKHGLRALSQQLRLELRESGIHVMLACPGPIRRADAGTRYASLDQASSLPAEAMKGGGGAKIKGLEPIQLAEDILDAAARRKLQIIRPRKAQWLIWLMALCPACGESILKRMTS